MGDWYEPWDLNAGTSASAFASEADALAEVRGLLVVNGAAYADDRALARRRADGGEPIAEGAELARRAEEAAPRRRTA